MTGRTVFLTFLLVVLLASWGCGKEEKKESTSTQEKAAPEQKADGTRAIQALVEALRSKSSSDRSAAADALGKIGPAAKVAAPDLAGALKDDDPDVRMNAAWALGRIGPEARAAVPALVEASRNNYDNALRDAATEAIRRIQAD